MNSPGFFRATWLVALKDLRLEFRTRDSVTTGVIFSLIVLVIFNFAFGLSAIRELGADRLVPGAIWIVLAFAAVVGLAGAMQLEREHDTIGALFLAPVDRGAVFSGKFLANLLQLKLCLGEIVSGL